MSFIYLHFDVIVSGYGDSASNLPLYLDNRLKDKLAQCFVSYDGWDKAMNASYIIQHSKSSFLHKIQLYIA